MKSPRPDSPIPDLSSIRTIRVESARKRDAPLATLVQQPSTVVPKENALLNNTTASIFPPRSTFSQKDPLPLPKSQRISLKPIVHPNRGIQQSSPSLHPTTLTPYNKDILTKAIPKQTETRKDSLVSISSSDDDDDEEEGNKDESNEEIESIPSKICESNNSSSDRMQASADLFIRSEPPNRVLATVESTRLQGWHCEKNFEDDSNINEMKIWPQILVSIVVSLAHLALGTVLAYPAILLPLLIASTLPASKTSPTTINASYLSSFQSYGNESIDKEHRITTEDFHLLGATMEEAKTETTNLNVKSTATIFQVLINNGTWENQNKNHSINSSDIPTSQENDGGFFPTIRISSHQAAWLASIHTVGALFGSMLCGSLLSVLGQRRSILLVSPIILTTWLTIWAAPSFALLITARLIAGVCIGILGTGAQVYIVEISHESIRGSLTIITDLYVGIGLLFTYSLGAMNLGWRWAALVIGFSTIIPLGVGLVFFPDSPRWLAMKGRKDDARRALQFLRGHTCNVTNEFDTIQRVCDNRVHMSATEQLAMLKNPAVYTPFLTSCGVFTFSQLSGPYVVYSYTVYIFEVANVGFSPYISTVIVGVARVIGSCIGIMVIEKAGRRLPLMIGGIGLALSLIVLGIYFYIKTNNPAMASELGWLPLTSMIIYTITLGASISPIPFLLSTELQPLSFRSLGSSASKGVFFISGMLVTYSFPVLKSSVGPAVTFWLYSLSALSLVCFVGLVVPETKGRSLEEIEQYYNRSSIK